MGRKLMLTEHPCATAQVPAPCSQEGACDSFCSLDNQQDYHFWAETERGISRPLTGLASPHYSNHTVTHCHGWTVHRGQPESLDCPLSGQFPGDIQACVKLWESNLYLLVHLFHTAFVVQSLVTCSESHSVVSDSCNPMDCSPPGSSVHGDSPSKNT